MRSCPSLGPSGSSAACVAPLGAEAASRPRHSLPCGAAAEEAAELGELHAGTWAALWDDPAPLSVGMRALRGAKQGRGSRFVRTDVAEAPWSALCYGLSCQMLSFYVAFLRHLGSAACQRRGDP